MTKSVDFSKIVFSPETQTLSIISENTEVLETINLTKASVKLQVIRNGDNWHAIVEEVAIGCLENSNLLEIKTRFDTGGRNAALFFGVLDKKLEPSIREGMTIGADEKFHLYWVGATDLRNNLIEETPTGLLLMEGKITSFEIQDNCLYLRHHDFIG